MVYKTKFILVFTDSLRCLLGFAVISCSNNKLRVWGKWKVKATSTMKSVLKEIKTSMSHSVDCDIRAVVRILRKLSQGPPLKYFLNNMDF